MSKYTFSFIFILCTSIVHSQTASISGVISTLTGELIPNTTVLLKGANYEQTVQTDASGTYLFSEVPTGETYTLEMERIGALLNGVSTLDLVMIMRNVLVDVDEFSSLSSAQMLAADVDQSGTVSVRDAWLLRQVILGISTIFETSNWRFVPVDYHYPDIIGPNTVTLTENIENLNFLGVKAGDVSGSARF